MATMNISLPDHMKEWVEAHIPAEDIDAYFEAMLMKDMEHKQALDQLNDEVEKGLASGFVKDFTVQKFLERKRAERHA